MISAKPKPPVDPRAYRPRRKPVTVAIGFVYDEGIVFCADTKITTNIKTTESKLDFFSSSDGCCAITFAMASDDITFPRSAARACWDMVKKLDFTSISLEVVHDAAQFALGEFYKEHIYPHPDRVPGAVYFEMLVAIWLREESRLYKLHETVLTSVDDYECIGAGDYLSKYLIQQYKRANPGVSTLADATLMADFCVKEAIEYDERCGGEPEILIMRNNGEFDNAYRTAVYPNYSLPWTFRQEMWKLLHDIAAEKMKGNINTSVPGLIERYCERIREAEAGERKWASGALPKRTE